MVNQDANRVVFQLRCDGAEWANVVGDFNDWDTRGTPMRQVEPGLWQAELTLPPGVYRFRYLTSNHGWVTDWAAFGLEPNGMGDWNSVLYVAKRGRRGRQGGVDGSTKGPRPAAPQAPTPRIDIRPAARSSQTSAH